MRILITGARGMLGKEIVKVFSGQHSVIATDIPELDITNTVQVTKSFHEFKPEFVLHLAAMTDVDGCERNPQDALRINGEGTKIIAQTCRDNHIPMLYISTSDIFDGTKIIPYIETDSPNPINQYGKSKYQGETYVRELNPDAYIIRPCWLFGGGKDDKKFVVKVMEQARTKSRYIGIPFAGHSLSIVNDVFGSPTYTVDLAEGIFKIVSKGKPGIYHVSNAGVATRYEIALKILEYANIKDCEIKGVSSKDFTGLLDPERYSGELQPSIPTPSGGSGQEPLRGVVGSKPPDVTSGDKLPHYVEVAPRPKMAAMTSINLKKIGLDNLMRPWQEALKEYITNGLA